MKYFARFLFGSVWLFCLFAQLKMEEEAWLAEARQRYSTLIHAMAARENARIVRENYQATSPPPDGRPVKISHAQDVHTSDGDFCYQKIRSIMPVSPGAHGFACQEWLEARLEILFNDIGMHGPLEALNVHISQDFKFGELNDRMPSASNLNYEALKDDQAAKEKAFADLLASHKQSIRPKETTREFMERSHARFKNFAQQCYQQNCLDAEVYFAQKQAEFDYYCGITADAHRINGPIYNYAGIYRYWYDEIENKRCLFHVSSSGQCSQLISPILERRGPWYWIKRKCGGRKKFIIYDFQSSDFKSGALLHLPGRQSHENERPDMWIMQNQPLVPEPHMPPSCIDKWAISVPEANFPSGFRPGGSVAPTDFNTGCLDRPRTILFLPGQIAPLDHHGRTLKAEGTFADCNVGVYDHKQRLISKYDRVGNLIYQNTELPPPAEFGPFTKYDMPMHVDDQQNIWTKIVLEEVDERPGVVEKPEEERKKGTAWAVFDSNFNFKKQVTDLGQEIINELPYDFALLGLEMLLAGTIPGGTFVFAAKEMGKRAIISKALSKIWAPILTKGRGLIVPCMQRLGQGIKASWDLLRNFTHSPNCKPVEFCFVALATFASLYSAYLAKYPGTKSEQEVIDPKTNNQALQNLVNSNLSPPEKFGTFTKVADAPPIFTDRETKRVWTWIAQSNYWEVKKDLYTDICMLVYPDGRTLFTSTGDDVT